MELTAKILFWTTTLGILAFVYHTTKTKITSLLRQRSLDHALDWWSIDLLLFAIGYGVAQATVGNSNRYVFYLGLAIFTIWNGWINKLLLTYVMTPEKPKFFSFAWLFMTAFIIVIGMLMFFFVDMIIGVLR